MTAVVLTRMWLNRTDTGEGISGASGRMPTTSHSKDGQRRRYASGRMRGIAVAGVAIDVPRRFVALDLAATEKLAGWLDQSVHCQLRDIRGQKWFGTFYDLEIGEYMRPDLYWATVTLLVTTTTEGV